MLRSVVGLQNGPVGFLSFFVCFVWVNPVLQPAHCPFYRAWNFDVDCAMLCIGAEVVAEDGLPSAAVDIGDVRLPVLKAVFGGSGGAVFVGAHAASADHQRFLDGRQYTRTAIRRSGWRLTWCLTALLLLCQS